MKPYEPKEPRTESSMACKIWSCANSKVNRKSWNFIPKKERGKVADLSPVIKPVSFGSKIYRLGSYTGTLDELKEFAAMKGLSTLRNGIVTYKTV